MVIQDEFQTLIEAIYEAGDSRRGIWKALRRDPSLRAAAIAHELLDPDDDLSDLDALAELEERDAAERTAAWRRAIRSLRPVEGAEPGFKPSRRRRTFAGSAAHRPRVVARSGRAAID